ncbi:hypothetical protein FOA52_010633 [Chlamydomonas sp. UWO 241]|nr:hypothetical protein FOA52_010633 [Chlamydomonas sp. UWO 241]
MENPVRRPHILLGLTGSVASIKAAQLCSLLLGIGELKVIATEAARKFINEDDLPPGALPLIGQLQQQQQQQQSAQEQQQPAQEQQQQAPQLLAQLLVLAEARAGRDGRSGRAIMRHTSLTVTWEELLAVLQPDGGMPGKELRGRYEGLHLVPVSKKTLGIKGAKAICAVGVDDKRQVTVVVSGAADGTLLPWQVIFTGKTDKSLPPKEFMQPWITHEKGAWVFSHTNNHWATLATTKTWFKEIYMPYCQRVKEALGLSPDHASMLMVDCWKIHMQKEFTEWVVETAPWCNLKFVPPNCTSVAQPMDVGIQKPFKDRLRDAFTAYVISKMMQHNPADGPPKLNLRLSQLKPLLPYFVGKAWEDLSAQLNITRNAWSEPGISACFGHAMQMEAATALGAGTLYPEGVKLVTVSPEGLALAPEGMAPEEDPGQLGVLGASGDADEWHSWKKVGDDVLHIELRRWADVLVIAPLSANTLAKVAGGLADNVLTCVVRAWDWGAAPMLVAPAMNTLMWSSPFTDQHLTVITRLGAAVVPPVSKRLACGDTGIGAMADPADIAAAVSRVLDAAGRGGGGGEGVGGAGASAAAGGAHAAAQVQQAQQAQQVQQAQEVQQAQQVQQAQEVQQAQQVQRAQQVQQAQQAQQAQQVQQA